VGVVTDDLPLVVAACKEQGTEGREARRQTLAGVATVLLREASLPLLRGSMAPVMTAARPATSEATLFVLNARDLLPQVTNVLEVVRLARVLAVAPLATEVLGHLQVAVAQVGKAGEGAAMPLVVAVDLGVAHHLRHTLGGKCMTCDWGRSLVVTARLSLLMDGLNYRWGAPERLSVCRSSLTVELALRLWTGLVLLLCRLCILLILWSFLSLLLWRSPLQTVRSCWCMLKRCHSLLPSTLAVARWCSTRFVQKFWRALVNGFASSDVPLLPGLASTWTSPSKRLLNVNALLVFPKCPQRRLHVVFIIFSDRCRWKFFARRRGEL
jgi:hypothetical protein